MVITAITVITTTNIIITINIIIIIKRPGYGCLTLRSWTSCLSRLTKSSQSWRVRLLTTKDQNAVTWTHLLLLFVFNISDSKILCKLLVEISLMIITTLSFIPIFLSPLISTYKTEPVLYVFSFLRFSSKEIRWLFNEGEIIKEICKEYKRRLYVLWHYQMVRVKVFPLLVDEWPRWSIICYALKKQETLQPVKIIDTPHFQTL